MNHEEEDEKFKKEIDRLVNRFEREWVADNSPDFAEFLKGVNDSQRWPLLRELVLTDIELRLKANLPCNPDIYQEFGVQAVSLAREVLDQPTEEPTQEEPTKPLGDNQDDSFETATVPPKQPNTDNHSSETGPDLSIPSSIARYQILKVLGSGGFGEVYLAFDEELERQVAIKVPRPGSQHSFDIDLYRSEAQNVAKLEHPNIVPVYDIGRTNEYACFIVSKYVDGGDLAKCIHDTQNRPNVNESVLIIKKIALALAYAHKQGLVHRDIKPHNILLEKETGEPFLVDFGMALREENYGVESAAGMTPPYMSPEQANGRGHRVDGRSDIFSLGITLYETLTGRRPFLGKSQLDLAIQITSDEHRPLRQVDETIPKELERIVDKTLEKKQADRYSTASDLANDLDEFLASNQAFAKSPTTTGSVASAGASSETMPQQTADTDGKPNESATSSLHVVPKGLRAFDENDADFFLELLPGPRDRNGIPDSIRFWKQKIEERDADETFPVGLVYGPSGCGKSSLMKAGLLPHLDRTITTIYLEATADQTEARLLKQIRKRCPELDSSLNLVDSLAALRRSGAANQNKLLIVIDQFEQWLHSRSETEGANLVNALSHCDGAHVQAIVMVRDDFWMAATRFMRELEIRLVEAENSAAVDLFPLRHATKVLKAYGRAFGVLPPESGQTTAEQEDFVKKSVEGLAVEGKVICVRLALFAEMMKGKSWTTVELDKVGGTSGIGTTFLEETFSVSTAPPEHRYHQKAARAVLQALLPDSGIDIKGQMKSADQLLAASGYSSRPKDFDALMRLLDNELRLITPTDKDGIANDETIVDGPAVAGVVTDSHPEASENARYYQLTHDFLVHSLREWLLRKQRETRQGRAEIVLKERVADWRAKPEQRFLPSLFEYLSIVRHTSRSNWLIEEDRMMKHARRFYLARSGLVFAIFLLIVGGAWIIRQKVNANHAQTLVDNSVNVSPEAIPFVLEELKPLQRFATTHLENKFGDDTHSVSEKLNLALLLGFLDKPRLEFIASNLTRANAGHSENIIRLFQRTPKNALNELRKAFDSARSQNDHIATARIAITSLYLNDAAMWQDLSRIAPNPEPRTELIEQFANWHGSLETLVPVAKDLSADESRFTLALAIGSLKKESIPDSMVGEWSDLFRDWYRQPQAATHSAADWALRSWGERHPTDLRPRDEASQWMVNEIGMTMIEVSPGEFTREDEKEKARVAQRVIFSNPFWMSDKEVTIKQFNEFLSDVQWANRPKNFKTEEFQARRQDDLSGGQSDYYPVRDVNWFEAIVFCNWLSDREKLAPYYDFGPTGIQVNRQANGYRLPSEAEWEYACRAGTATTFFHGNNIDRLNKYGVLGSMQPKTVGSQLPNGWGFFDFHGNVTEWCNNVDTKYRNRIIVCPFDSFAEIFSRPQGNRIIRGGSYDSTPRVSRSLDRSSAPPGRHRGQSAYGSFGFRVARNRLNSKTEFDQNIFDTTQRNLAANSPQSIWACIWLADSLIAAGQSEKATKVLANIPEVVAFEVEIKFMHPLIGALQKTKFVMNDFDLSNNGAIKFTFSRMSIAPTKMEFHFFDGNEQLSRTHSARLIEDNFKLIKQLSIPNQDRHLFLWHRQIEN